MPLPCSGDNLAYILQNFVTTTPDVEGDEGFSILTSCGQDAVFLVLAGKGAKQGVLMLEIKRAIAQLKQALL